MQSGAWCSKVARGPVCLATVLLVLPLVLLPPHRIDVSGRPGPHGAKSLEHVERSSQELTGPPSQQQHCGTYGVLGQIFCCTIRCLYMVAICCIVLLPLSVPTRSAQPELLLTDLQACCCWTENCTCRGTCRVACDGNTFDNTRVSPTYCVCACLGLEDSGWFLLRLMLLCCFSKNV
jgi:hypothetical protein